MMRPRKTISLCDVCYKETPGTIFQRNSEIWIEKHCPEHGIFQARVEKDANFYERFSVQRPLPEKRFNSLIIPVSFRCNLQCANCFAPDRGQEDLSAADIEKAIRAFEGNTIFFSGGEPTVRRDLPALIRMVKRSYKACGIVTNGLKLANDKYLLLLKDAGLDFVFFSLDSFRQRFYQKNKQNSADTRDILSLKLSALDNLKTEQMTTILSATIYNGENEAEMKDLFEYAMRNRSFISEIRFRSCVNIGRHSYRKEYFTSDLVKMFCAQTNLNPGILLETHLLGYLMQNEHTIHHVMVGVSGVWLGKTFCPTGNTPFEPWPRWKKLLFLIKLAFMYSPASMVKAFRTRPIFRTLMVRFIHWPTVENVDLGQIDRDVAHLYGKDKILNFCHTIILIGRDAQQDGNEDIHPPKT
ncbi:MAG: radical SAM protein [Desulfobacterales bacterium]|nr:radical SAM protein [Desulfobacterales bacterium]